MLRLYRILLNLSMAGRGLPERDRRRARERPRLWGSSSVFSANVQPPTCRLPIAFKTVRRLEQERSDRMFGANWTLRNSLGMLAGLV